MVVYVAQALTATGRCARCEPCGEEGCGTEDGDDTPHSFSLGGIASVGIYGYRGRVSLFLFSGEGTADNPLDALDAPSDKKGLCHLPYQRHPPGTNRDHLGHLEQGR